MKRTTKTTLLIFSFLLNSALSSELPADIAVIVNPTNPVNHLSKKQISMLFLKQVKAYPQGNKVRPLNLHRKNPVSKKFYTEVVGKTGRTLSSYWAKIQFSGRGTAPEVLRSPDAMLKAVKEDPQAIGYIDLEKVNDGVKVIFVLIDEAESVYN